MLGLRTQENETFEKFVSLIEDDAKKNNCVFFVDTQESVETLVGEDNPIECMELSGWLIPNDKVEEFRADYESFKDLEKWDEYVAWVTWSETNGKIDVNIELL